MFEGKEQLFVYNLQHFANLGSVFTYLFSKECYRLELKLKNKLQIMTLRLLMTFYCVDIEKRTSSLFMLFDKFRN